MDNPYTDNEIEEDDEKIYKFDELSADAQRRAIEEFSAGNLDYDWWNGVYDDASQIGLKIDSFDLDRNRHATGKLTENTLTVIENILKNHGDVCETYQTASRFFAEIQAFRITKPDEYEEYGTEDFDDEFLKSLLEDYAKDLQDEYEWLQSAENIIESIQANEYEFNYEGVMI